MASSYLSLTSHSILSIPVLSHFAVGVASKGIEEEWWILRMESSLTICSEDQVYRHPLPFLRSIKVKWDYCYIYCLHSDSPTLLGHFTPRGPLDNRWPQAEFSLTKAFWNLVNTHSSRWHRGCFFKFETKLQLWPLTKIVGEKKQEFFLTWNNKQFSTFPSLILPQKTKSFGFLPTQVCQSRGT